jgi:hypothetical protein
MKKPDRKCGDCTRCCEGWLNGEAHGHKFYAGKPCHFLSACSGCSIYKDRPQSPCIDYKCGWLAEPDFLPEWMRPDHSNVIIHRKTWGANKDKPFLLVIECGKKMDSTVLSWLYQYAIPKQLPMSYQIDGGWNYLGPTSFIEEMDRDLIQSLRDSK